MADFHFLRPWWLAALPLGIWLIWRMFRQRAAAGGWSQVVDPALRAHVLVAPEVLVERRWPLVVALAAFVLATVALAGPTWERLPVPAFRSEDALVVALDMSRSMDAADVQPNRLARAKLKLLSLLERRSAGQTALVVFSAHAFTVTPLTTDTRTIASLVSALTTDIMPSQGSYIEAGLDKAARLLHQSGMNRGEVLVITDSDVSPDALELARELRREGMAVHVLAVGTEDGAPIPQSGGGFMTDRAGRVVVPRVDPASLRRLADVGGGRFAQLAPDDRDLEALFPPNALGTVGAPVELESEQYEADVWRDRGVWLALALLPLIALGFRRGWISVWLVALALPVTDAQAFEWRDLWLRNDQQGLAAMRSEDPARAAELFDDRAWRGAAQYRAGDFSASASTLAGVDSADGHYNRGNALAKAGQARAAIEAYDRALELDPEHADAQYNRDLLEEYLKQNPEQDPSSQSEQGERGEEQRNASGSSDPQDAERDGQQAQDNGSGAEQRDPQSGADPQQNARSQSNQPDPDDSLGSDDSEAGTDSAQADAARDDAEQRDEQEASAEPQAGDEDVEQWASEQAADQWLRRVRQDPGGLLRRKFLYQYQRLGVDQDGNYVWPGDEESPW